MATLTFPIDNALAQELGADRDRLLEAVAERAGARVSLRGNEVIAEGSDAAVAQVRLLLEELAGLVEQGLPVGQQTVDAIVGVLDADGRVGRRPARRRLAPPRQAHRAQDAQPEALRRRDPQLHRDVRRRPGRHRQDLPGDGARRRGAGRPRGRADQLASVDDTLAKKAAEEIDDKEQQAILAAVYLVAKMENGVPVGKATAWAFTPNMLATNAHVTSQMDLKKDSWVLIGPKGEQIPIKDVKSHPGYASFKDYLPTVGGTKGGKFEQLDVINEYDVGIIFPGTPLPAEGRAQPATLDPATEDEVKSLKPGAPVAAVGFPIEGMTASMVVEHAPATLHFGNISSLTDVFMCRADDAKDQLLIQHTVPVTGGMSGSPLVDGSGKVVGIVSGGNTDNFVTEVTVPKGGDQAANTNEPRQEQT